jgi:hypothetical protein
LELVRQGNVTVIEVGGLLKEGAAVFRETYVFLVLPPFFYLVFIGRSVRALFCALDKKRARSLD